MTKTTLPVLLSIIVVLTACDTGPKSPRGFSLPVGDVTRGEEVFKGLGCLSCHTLDGVEMQGIEKDPEISVGLGGEVSRVKTYAELVTSIINPSHRIARGYKLSMVKEDGQSKMINYNDVMTVSQLIDLVSFLQPHYELREYQPTSYTGYH